MMLMRHAGRILGATLAVLMTLALPVYAGLKTGKIQSSLTNPANTAGPFTNTSAKGSFSFKGVKFSIKAKKTTVADTDGQHCTSDDIICLVSFVATLNGGTQVPVWTALSAEASGGTIVAAHDLCEDRDPTTAAADSVFCPEYWKIYAPISINQTSMTCYAADPAWASANPLGSLFLTGHTCEGIFIGTGPSTPASAVLYSDGMSLYVP